jgi:serine/threonine-protein kinase
MLAQTERVLVETLGPVARVLVRKTAQQVGSPAELAQQLATAIPSEPERLAFQRRMRAIVGGTLTGLGTGQGSSVMGSQVSASMGPFDQDFLEKVRRDLAAYLGPIAKVLVKQAAGKAKTPQELYQRLAEQIPAAADRAAFLKRAPMAGG